MKSFLTNVQIFTQFLLLTNLTEIYISIETNFLSCIKRKILFRYSLFALHDSVALCNKIYCIMSNVPVRSIKNLLCHTSIMVAQKYSRVLLSMSKCHTLHVK